jgi:murein DD-endopeptidase MepM/ murein hydrolase activator NlpD
MSFQKQKQNTNLISRGLVAAILLSLICGSSSAQTSVGDLQNSISQKQQQLDHITNQIQDLQNQINKQQKQAASLKNEISLYDLHIQETQQQIAAVQIQIDQSSAQILQTQIEIQHKQDDIDKQKVFLAETLRLINEYDGVSPLELVLKNDTFSQFLDQVQYAGDLQAKTQTLLDTIKKLQTELQQKRTNLQTQLASQQRLKDELVQSQNSLAQQRTDKQYLLNKTKGQQKIYQSLLTDASQKQQQVEQEIYQLDQSVRQQLGQKALPPFQGVLQWPMSGIISQGYGNTGFTALGYNFHNGIDIAAPAGTPIYAAATGVVYATGTGQTAYGNWVVIKHTLTKDGKIYNIYTLYGHMQKFVVTPGQTAHGTDVIGYEGNTGNTTRLLYGPERGYHLHFTIFDEDGFGIREGANESIYGPYQIPYGYTYNPLDFLK